jgi:hypothetical protein
MGLTVGQDLKNIKIPGSFAIVELVDGAGLVLNMV